MFGATGDLAKRKIYPALYNLFIEGKLPSPFSIIGLGRREWSHDIFQTNVSQSLDRFSRRKPADPESVEKFVAAFRYSVLDIDRQEDYLKLRELIESREAELGVAPNRLFYLSVGPEYFTTIANHIQEGGLGSEEGWKRLVIEKPFGRDLQSARELNRELSRSFAEEEIYRIDHYLGKPMVQKLESLQQANPAIHALWNRQHISNVQITANESVGVEERAGYYDRAGAVRDMFQNHLLQLLMMAAIQLPHASTPDKVRFKKKLVLEALEPLSKENVAVDVVRGQYEGYAAEPGIAPGSMTDTLIAARLRIDNSVWRGVPFYLRTGKKMKDKSTRIVFEFKEPLKTPWAKDAERAAPNLLVVEIGPNEGITLHLNEKDPEGDGTFKPLQVTLQAGQADAPEAYENLIYDAWNGDPTFFAHWDEIELSWKWVQPILDAFEENLVPLHPYAAGSYGPQESDALPEQDGFRWLFDDKPEIPTETRKGEQYAYHAND